MLTDIIYSIEKQGRFDYDIHVCELEDGSWQGTLAMTFHNHYPSDYKTCQLPKLPVGKKSDAVEKIYSDKGIKKR